MQVSLHHKGQIVDQGAPKTECAAPIFETEIYAERADLDLAELSIHIRRLCLDGADQTSSAANNQRN